jgi:nucleoside-diphosphate-sugar epimerase
MLDTALENQNRRPSKYIFLGASGRIGQLLQSVYSQDTIPSIDIKWQYRHPQSNLRDIIVWPDFSDPTPVVDYARSVGGIDGLFVFSSPAAGADRQTPQALSLNITLVEQVIQAAKFAQIPRVIVASSSAVYGVGKGSAFSEQDTLSPANPYGQAKSEMEKRCTALAQELGVELCLLRLGNIAGADALLGAGLMRSHNNGPVSLDIFPDGCGPQRSYIGPQSLLTVLCDLAAFSDTLPLVLNVAAQNPVSMNAILDAAGIPWIARYVAASGAQNIILDCQKLARLLPAARSDNSAREIVEQWYKALKKS